MHAIEKIMAKACGKTTVQTGEIIMAAVDFAEINDLYLQTVYSFREMGGTKVWDPNKVAFVFDHFAPASTIKAAGIHKEMREFAKEQELTHHFDINCGVCHQVMPEAGLVYPGMILVATDSHTTTHGAFGALGTGVGATDMATILMTGELWMRVPEIIEIRIDGVAGKAVAPKDVILHVLGRIKADGAVYKAIEFTGTYVESLNVAGRMVLCNMAVEMGAKTAYIQPNADVINYVNSRVTQNYEVVYSDPGFTFDEVHLFDITELTPQVAVPSSVDNVSEITSAKIRVDQCFVGTCTGGRLEDLKIAADTVRGKKIAPGVRLLIIPASAEVMQDAMEQGYIKDLMQSGATISTPGCGPCLGAHEGIMAPGEVCVSASNRNFPGRMGSTEAGLYLASPQTVAASALTGYLTDPRTLEEV
ncbi:MAG: 3-isopropylmalate dehydratase large subunit [Clostridiaceae bacterium]